MTNEKKTESIWKSVEELPPYSTDLIVKTTGWDYIIGTNLEQNNQQVIMTRGVLNDGNVINDTQKFCTLTDFVNHIESLEQRIKKLEGK